MARVSRVLSLLLFSGVLATFAFTGSASAAAGCDLYASPSGSDSGTGQLDDPLATVRALDEALTPGQTGCVEAGTYGSVNSGWMNLDNSGTSSGQITITAEPGQSVKLVGFIALTGNYATLTGFNIDGSNTVYDIERSGTHCPYPVSEGLEIDGHDDIFENNNLYQSIPSLRGNGLGIGWNGQADNTIVRFNRIHDVGQCMAYDHVIYLSHGNSVRIYDNWMWNDAHGWGVQVYPDASNARIFNNVIDNAGSGFVVGGSSAVAGNRLYHNVVMNSSGLVNAGLAQGVGLSTCCGLGAGNSFSGNVSHDNPGGVAEGAGIAMSGNTTASPKLADPAAHDFRVTSSTPAWLASWGMWNGNLGPDQGDVAHTASAHVASAPAHPRAGIALAPDSVSKTTRHTSAKTKTTSRRKASRDTAAHHASHRRTARHHR
jgi:hypothetical protein